MKEINRMSNVVKKELDSLNPLERIVRTLDEYIERDPRGELPQTIVLNKEFFTKWFHWCKENDKDFRTIGIATIALKRKQPFEITIIHNKITEEDEKI